MARPRGLSSAVSSYLRAVAAFLYRKSTDPNGMLRHRGLGPRDDVFEDCPQIPAYPLYGWAKEFTWTNAYDVNTTSIWTQVVDTAGTALAVQDERGGVAKFTNAAGDNDHYSYHNRVEFVKLSSTQDVWFFTRIRILDVDQADWYVGLLAKINGTTGTADAVFDARVDGIGFYGTDGSALIYCESTKNSTPTQTSSGKSLTDNTFEELAFHVCDTTTVEFFVNHVYVTTMSTNLPDDEEITVAFGCRNGQAVANAMSIGRTLVIQDE